MQHSILFKNPGYYSAFPLILSNSTQIQINSIILPEDSLINKINLDTLQQRMPEEQDELTP